MFLAISEQTCSYVYIEYNKQLYEFVLYNNAFDTANEIKYIYNT